MKISITIMSVFMSGAVMAQGFDGQMTNKHEFRVGYSDAIPLTIASGLSEALGQTLVAGINDSKIKTLNSKSIGFLEAGYRYQISDRFKVGADVGFMNENRTVTYTKNGTTKADTTKSTTRYVTVLPNVQFSYIKTAIIDFYGSASVGVIFAQTSYKNMNTRGNNTGFAFQVNPVGIRVGKKLGGFLEAGFGYKGLINAGLSLKL